MNLVLFINFCLHCPGKLLFCNLEFEKLNCVLSSDLLSLKGLRELEPEEIDDWLLFITVSSFPPSLLSSECSVATPLYPVTLRVSFFSCPPPPQEHFLSVLDSGTPYTPVLDSPPITTSSLTVSCLLFESNFSSLLNLEDLGGVASLFSSLSSDTLIVVVCLVLDQSLYSCFVLPLSSILLLTLGVILVAPCVLDCVLASQLLAFVCCSLFAVSLLLSCLHKSSTHHLHFPRAPVVFRLYLESLWQ